ncbi:IucA/IucC family protein [Xenorhabdus szentirmaii]|uniref:Aerobactin siderophore biosynthesis protein iucA n=1 Tax=Xenorhabdus szentirmaii DSM 16338 TaxID=1427518 RepID=W1J1V4_9GAMM|nr:IucA/IucC family protein [Xenorhabdus szentirmaii]PHM31589.1 aerobactin siderophore biosynthesis protein IucA [Xenorhabdus szentirmaii DSM 16338]PHM42028.1 aerobactin siderophore biosynthesis protein IucA [Xenorhabdus szentirmaii]CDL83405.1 Aerobactin siderophore biosynthesis protein iucA [Xenorhabdus szentirmaii DSM 16338]
MYSKSCHLKTDIAAQCFINALIRETQDWEIFSPTNQLQYPQLHIPLSDTQSVRIALRYVSPTHHHQYLFPPHLYQNDNTEYRILDMKEFVSLLLEKLKIHGTLSDVTIERFYQRVMESHDNTWQAINIRLDWPMLRDKPLNFAEAEQGLLAGHAFHPAPKSHEPFDAAQARRYLPDFAARFPLRWFAVNSSYICGDSLELTLKQRLQRFTAESAPHLLSYFSDETWLVPMHPWQAEYLLNQDWTQALVQKGHLHDLGEAGTRWLPTSSSRSLYSETNHDMIKYSLSVRLTNSIRTLSVKEVNRGMRLARLAKTPRWQELQARYPTMRVMQEDGWAGLRDIDGTIREESLMAFRANLLFGRPDVQTNVLVTLTQPAPDGGDSLLASSIRRLSTRLNLSLKQSAHCWLDAYCQHILLPLFSAEANYGLVLLAHQQNILVEMEQDLPIGLLYRDCQGSGFTQSAASWLGEIGEAEAENRFTDSQLLRYFPYYLLVNSTLAVTAAMGAAGFDREENLMGKVRDALIQLRTTAQNTLCLDYVLDSPHWNCKGNFFCYLHDHNENTIVDPAIIYFDFANPLVVTHDLQGLTNNAAS